MEGFFRRFSAFVLLCLLATAALAQTTTGTISGQVTDPSGAVVPGANVTVTDPQTGKTYTTVTTSDGQFSVTALPVGFYRVKVTAKGFSDGIYDQVQVNLGQTALVNSKLAVGTTAQEVVVTGEQQAVQTDSAQISASIDRRAIMNLPLNTRNPLDLVKSMPGTANVGSDIFVHGLRSQTVNLMQDGVNVSDNYVKTSGFFSLIGSTVDSVSEFTVTSSAGGTDTGYGSTQVNMATASGTNTLHGAVYWYQRTSFLNANPYFNGINGQKTPFQLQNRIGYQIGGPVIIPKIYHGKNKTFFFNNFEVFRQPAQQNTNRLILADPARTGTFTYNRADNGQPVTVNLVTGQGLLGSAIKLNGPAGAGTITPAVNAAVMNYYNSLVPSANSDSCTGADAVNLRCFTWNVPGSSKSNRYVGRIDQTIGDHNTASFVMNILRTRTQSDFLNNDFPFFPKSFGAGQGGIRELWSWSLRTTIGNTRTNNATFGIQRSPVDFFINDTFAQTGGYQLNVGCGSNPGNCPTSAPSAPSFTSTNLPQGRNTPVWEASDTFGWVHGKHNMSFGGDYRQVKATNYFYNSVIPNVNLGNNASNPDGLTAAKFPGGLSQQALTNAQTVFDTVTGLIGSTVQGFNHTSATSGFVAGQPRNLLPIQHNFAFFAQDSWRIRPDLTIQGGLRWEFQGVFDMRNGLILQPDNRLQGAFGPAPIGDFFTPVGTPAVTDVPLAVAGGKNNKPLYNRQWKNFAPFIGFAWDPTRDGKTAIRAGYAIHYTTDGFTFFAPAATGNTGLFSTITNSNPVGVFNPSSVPTPAVPADILPVSEANNYGLGHNVSITNNVVAFDRNLSVPYVMEWNFAVQREVAKGTTVEVRYVGNHAAQLYRTVNINELNLLNNPYSAGGASVANLLTEFNNAASNLAICSANRAACTGSATGTLTFANNKLPGQVPLPILQTLLNGISASSGFASPTFVTNLQQGQVFSMFNTLRTNALYYNNRVNNFPLNFFVPNPWAAQAQYVGNYSWSNYNGLEAEVRRRFSGGLQASVNYTYGKTLTDQHYQPNSSQNDSQPFYSIANQQLDKSVAPWNITHNIAGNFIYELPFGRGKMFAGSSNRFVDMLIGGFSFNGTVNWSSGLPYSFLSNRFTTGAAGGLGSNAVLRNMTIDQFKKQLGVFKVPGGVFFINPTSGLITVTTKTGSNGLPSVSSVAAMCTAGQTTPCFDHPAAGQYGNMPYLGFNGPQFVNVDSSLIKSVHLSTEHTERVLQLRLELFNALNHANFSVPNGVPTSTTVAPNVITSNQFGQLLGVVDTGRGGGVNARLIQWAIRINF